MLAPRPRSAALPLLLLAGLLAGGCSTAYYAAMEQLGWAKRDILANRITQCSDAQDRAAKTFHTALTALEALAYADAASRPPRFDALHAASAAAEAAAADVRNRVAAVQAAGTALFTEWTAEIAATRDGTLRAQRQQLFTQARGRYDDMVESLDATEAAMAPVLDQLRHPITAMAGDLTDASVATLRAGLPALHADVARLVTAMERSIIASDQFGALLEKTV